MIINQNPQFTLSQKYVKSVILRMGRLKNWELGQIGELFVCTMLNSVGLDAYLAYKYTDLMVNGIRIEVKVSRPKKNGYYGACLYKEGHTDIKNSQYVIWIHILKGDYVVYLIPVKDLENKKHFNLKPFSSKIAKYLVTWDEISETLTKESKESNELRDLKESKDLPIDMESKVS